MLPLNSSRLRRRAAAAALLPAWFGCSAGPHEGSTANRDDERVQAKVSACLGLDIGASIAFFLPSRLGGVADGSEAQDCVNAADTCPAVKACGGYAADPCVSGTQRCEAGAAYNCWPAGGGLESRQRCGNNNNRCSIAETEKDGLVALCHGDSCARDYCDGSNLVRCVGGWEVREDCSRDGRTCFESPGGPLCSHADQCTRDTCRGDELRLCALGRVLLTAECGSVLPGSHCIETSGSAECRATTPDPECSGHPELETWCEGDLGIACMGGVRSEVDCAELSGGRCVVAQFGDEGDTTRARCRASATDDSRAPLLGDPLQEGPGPSTSRTGQASVSTGSRPTASFGSPSPRREERGAKPFQR
jgi:hypothetical protein